MHQTWFGEVFVRPAHLKTFLSLSHIKFIKIQRLYFVTSSIRQLVADFNWKELERYVRQLTTRPSFSY